MWKFVDAMNQRVEKLGPIGTGILIITVFGTGAVVSIYAYKKLFSLGGRLLAIFL